MIFGISGTKRTVRNREVAGGVRKERLDCILWQMQTLMCYCTVFALFYFEFEGNFRVQSIWGFSSFLKKAFVKYQTIDYPTSSGFSRPDATLRKERNHRATKQL